MSIFSRTHSRLIRVTRTQPCPICGKPDWCSVGLGFAVCMRVPSYRLTRNGGFLHQLDFLYRIQLALPVARRATADIVRRHAVYTALLEALELKGCHANSLVRRGLSEETITRNLYASASPNCQQIVQELAREFDLTGVPGFYQEHGQWRFVAANWSEGIFIPVRDAQERIQALQFRFDQGETRYAWVSSNDKPSGTSSGTPMHYATPYRVQLKPDARVWFTEGALKADIIADQLEQAVVAIAGVNAFTQNMARQLMTDLPSLSAITIAFDADAAEKPQVAHALERAAFLLHSGGLRVQIAKWNPSLGKGLDDVLVGRR